VDVTFAKCKSRNSSSFEAKPRRHAHKIWERNLSVQLHQDV
jgi:hypothetical protein